MVVALFCVLPLLVCGCATDRSAPKAREIIMHSEVDDERVGGQASLRVADELGIVDDPELAAYVSAVGKRVARHAPRGRYRYQFQVVDQGAANAFALPGGYIYVSRGMLVLANSEDELAGMLGHEITHVAARHTAARQAMVNNLGPLEFVAGGSLAGYGREQERESDRLGQNLAGRAGYDPRGLSNLLRSLELEERLQHGASRLPRFYDTHPVTSERIATASSRAFTVPWERVPAIAGDRAGYLARIDGLAVGTGAKQGVFRGRLFLHPDLDFSVRFPSGWHTINTRQAVGAWEPRRHAVVLLEHQGAGDDPEQAASEYLQSARQYGLRIDTLERVRLGELSAVRATGSARAMPVQLTWAAPTVSVQLTWIAYGSSIYRLTCMSRIRTQFEGNVGIVAHRVADMLRSRGRFDGTFRSVARSFQPLRPEVRRSIQQKRLRIATARAGESLKQLSRRTGNTWDLQQTAVMNGIFTTDRLEADQLVKVAVAEDYDAAPERSSEQNAEASQPTISSAATGMGF
jgi:predicted Zn-dependent protease